MDGKTAPRYYLVHDLFMITDRVYFVRMWLSYGIGMRTYYLKEAEYHNVSLKSHSLSDSHVYRVNAKFGGHDFLVVTVHKITESPICVRFILLFDNPSHPHNSFLKIRNHGDARNVVAFDGGSSSVDSARQSRGRR